MKRFVMVTVDSARWSTAKTAIVGVEGDYPWTNAYGQDAFDFACARWHMPREECRLVDYTLLPDDTLFVNCGDFL